MRQEKAETRKTRLDRKWLKLKEIKLKAKRRPKLQEV